MEKNQGLCVNLVLSSDQQWQEGPTDPRQKLNVLEFDFLMDFLLYVRRWAIFVDKNSMKIVSIVLYL